MSARTTVAHAANEVREALELVDGMSQGAFERIASLAWLCRLALDPRRPLDPTRTAELGHALDVIEYLAKETMNDINVEAERVGCNHVGPARRA